MSLIRRHAVITFATLLLLASTALSAAARPAALNKQPGVHQEDRGTEALLDRLFPIKPLHSVTAKESVYCSRAIDIGGLFCAIGCPNTCTCSFGLYVSQCCCDSAAQ